MKPFKQVSDEHHPLIATKWGSPIIKPTPIDTDESKDYFRCMKDSVTIQGDVISPIDVEWNANEE